MNQREKYVKIINYKRSINPFINNMELAYELLLSDIANGILQSGERIRQEYIAELFQMSRTPVRDALYKLESEGIVIKNETGGYCVCTLRIKDYMDFSDYRLLIESRAAYLAARNINISQLKNLEKNLNETIEACNKAMWSRLFGLDQQFHDIIVEASCNKYLIDATQKYAQKREFYNRLVLGDNSLSAIKNKHEEIYKAIRENDEDLAKKVMVSHLSFYMKNLAVMMG